LNDYNLYGILTELNLFEYKNLLWNHKSKLKTFNSNIKTTLFIDEHNINKNPIKRKKSSIESNDSNQNGENFIKNLIDKLDENMYRIHLINVKQLVFKQSFYNGLVFLNEDNSPNPNSIGKKIEINNITINLPTKSMKTLIKNIIQLILIGKKENIINGKVDQINPDKVIPIEKLVYKEMQTNLKKFKLLIKNIEVNFKSDNNLSTDFIIKINKYCFLNTVNLIYTIDPRNQKLLNNSIDLRFQDIRILADIDSYILNVPNYNLNILEEIFYSKDKQGTKIKKLIASDLSNFFIFAHTEKLNKILENVIEIVDGVDKIDSLTVPLQKIEHYNCETEINLNFKNFHICLFNENLMLNIRNLTMALKIEQTKFSHDNISITFLPFILTISNPIDTNVLINNESSRFNFFEKNKNKKRILNTYFGIKTPKNFNDNSSTSQSFMNNLIFETNEFYYVSDIMLQNFKIEINETKFLSSSNDFSCLYFKFIFY